MARASGSYVVAGIVLAALVGAIVALRYRVLSLPDLPGVGRPVTTAGVAGR